jgi:tRNA(Ile2) C34 agmatinyltransferase TiaS
VRPEENTLELSQQQNLTDSKITPLAHSLDISRPKIENLGIEQTQKVLINMMGDAPACNVCGHITIRNGTCYKCLNCGNSLGCS